MQIDFYKIEAEFLLYNVIGGGHWAYTVQGAALKLLHLAPPQYCGLKSYDTEICNTQPLQILYYLYLNFAAQIVEGSSLRIRGRTCQH